MTQQELTVFAAMNPRVQVLDEISDLIMPAEIALARSVNFPVVARVL